jgi:hypothetical protein
MAINKSSEHSLDNIMMTNQLPPNATLPAIYSLLATSHRHGARNRCLYRLRLVASYKDIVGMCLGDVLSGDGRIHESMTLCSGSSLQVCAEMSADLLDYLQHRFQRKDLRNIVFMYGSDHLFTTQKSPKFSPGWLAQLFSHLDRYIRGYFKSFE